MEYRISEGILTIEPGEEIDHHRAEMIIRYAENLIRQRRVSILIFDLEETVFMDSAGVGMMIGLYREMKMCGGAVGIIHMHKSIRRIYQMAGLQRIICCYEDEQQMMAAVREGGGNNEG
ncbi:MAG: anti-sigma factor antagonist [Coprococcus sp.]